MARTSWLSGGRPTSTGSPGRPHGTLPRPTPPSTTTAHSTPMQRGRAFVPGSMASATCTAPRRRRSTPASTGRPNSPDAPRRESADGSVTMGSVRWPSPRASSSTRTITSSRASPTGPAFGPNGCWTASRPLVEPEPTEGTSPTCDGSSGLLRAAPRVDGGGPDHHVATDEPQEVVAIHGRVAVGRNQFHHVPPLERRRPDRRDEAVFVTEEAVPGARLPAHDERHAGIGRHGLEARVDGHEAGLVGRGR